MNYKVGDFIKFTYIKDYIGIIIMRVIGISDIKAVEYKVKVLHIEGKSLPQIEEGYEGYLVVDYKMGKYEDLSFERGIIYEL